MTPRTLTPGGSAAPAPRFISAEVLPERGMMLARLRVRLSDGSEFDLVGAAPAPVAAARFGTPDDFAGNLSFAFGGAILLPYANRLRGEPVAGGREITTTVAGARVRLPANWGGKAPGSERYAMHGLMLDRAFTVTHESGDAIAGTLRAGDFGGRWPSATGVAVAYRLTATALSLQVTATNIGQAPLPMGIGWHPYFALPSGDRRSARLHIPARRRLAVADYDAVLPTGEILPLAATAYDFSPRNGRALGDTFLDDCFVDLVADAGRVTATLIDPAVRLGVRIATAAPPVTAFQVYAPPEQPFVAIEPQFNWTDPASDVWRDTDTGMAILKPGESVQYAISIELFPFDRP